jgi:hypothetical protein
MDTKKFLTPKNILGTIALTLLLGILSSALWDLLFKPGLTEFGRILLSIATFGSTTIKDLAYASAALDPTPIPALLAVVLASWTPVFIVVAIVSVQIGTMYGRQSADKAFEDAKKVTAGDLEKLKEVMEARITRLQRFLKWFLGVNLIIVSALSVTTSTVLNQSVSVWRTFHADLAICAPHLTPLEEKQFRARFASMTTRVEYLAISNDLQQVAAKNAVKLVNIELW